MTESDVSGWAVVWAPLPRKAFDAFHGLAVRLLPPTSPLTYARAPRFPLLGSAITWTPPGTLPGYCGGLPHAIHRVTASRLDVTWRALY